MALYAVNADFPGPPPEPAEAALRIGRHKDRRRDALACGLVLAAGCCAALAWEPSLAAAFGAGLVAALAIAGLSHAFLCDFVDECAMHPCMSGQPDVASRQSQLVEPDQLATLARCLRRRADARDPARLSEIADALERERTADPVAVARLWTLMRLGAVGPLYETTLAGEQLDAVLHQALRRIEMRGSEH